ncbi:MAG: peptidase T [Lachnospiraceae bacterium]|nr:peptidase T [Lachnospiraceae bacterium]
MSSSVIEKFLRYVKIDTESLSDQEQVPSTEKQKDLGRLLVEELQAMGAEDPHMDDHGYVYAWIPATVAEDDPRAQGPVIGFIAHMDTSEAVTGKDVKPRIVENYNGQDIVLHEELGYTLHTAEFPDMLNYVGKDLIVTDGTTLLGADDKAGIAEIMTMAEYLLAHPEIPHRRIPIAFTPDEEVGRGVDFFNVAKFGADFAYTVDGGAAGEIEYENFNAAGVKLTIHGKSVHPGSSKNKMINAILVASEFQNLLPVHENPSATEGYEGFYHPNDISGGCEEVIVHYIIRDHDKDKFEQKKAFFQVAADFINAKYGKGTAVVQMRDSYYNMREMVEPHAHLIDNARTAIRACGLEPITTPVRGGTDGARLSFMGLPCPNLGTGGHNFHGRYEYACVQSMETTVAILKKIVEIYTEAK